MADHMAKKYIAKVEKTQWIVETVEIIAESEKDAEELLDNYCCDGTEDFQLNLIEREVQEEEVNAQYIDESEALSVDEFMEITGGQTLYRAQYEKIE